MSTSTMNSLHVLVSFFWVYYPCHHYICVACHNSSEVGTATRTVCDTVSDEHTAPRLSVRFRKFIAQNNIFLYFGHM